MSFPYRSVFGRVEETLLSYGSRHKPRSAIVAELAPFRALPLSFSDDEFFWRLVCVVFYSGFRASTVTGRLPVIREHLGDYRRVAAYTADDVARVLADPRMVRNRGKVAGVVKNARVFAEIVAARGSFQAYVEGFQAADSWEGLVALKEDLQRRFSYLGGVTVYHFLTEIGLPVVKPDRVLRRIFSRLGLVAGEDDTFGTVREGRRFAQETGHPIRYIDIVFVAYGQVSSPEFGIDKGICLKTPRCRECGIRDSCRYPDKSS